MNADAYKNAYNRNGFKDDALTAAQYREITDAVCEAGMMLKNARPGSGSVHKKEGAANFVTDFDVQIQQFLIKRLAKALPEAAFFGEEDTGDNAYTAADGAPYCFYIDPIDGTTNFIFDYRHSCVSVGLAVHGQMHAGFVCNPYTEELYAAVRGQGAYRNGERLLMQDISVGEGIVAFGCARYNEGDTDLLFAVMKELFYKSLSIRNGGSSALDLCRIAGGCNAAYLELKLQPYDYAAASVIVEEAGGAIGQTDGTPVRPDGPCSVLAGTKRAVKEIRKILDAEAQKSGK